MVQALDVISRPEQRFQNELLTFLMSPALVDRDGFVYSWVNPNHPGYIYPEIMGLYLTLASQIAAAREDALLAACARRVAEALQAIVPPSGGLGKDGKVYLFDVCMAITGLLTFRDLLDGCVDPAVLARLAQFATDMAESRRAVLWEDERTGTFDPHWSTVIGASALKTVIAFDGLARETGDSAYTELAIDLAQEVISRCFNDGMFQGVPGSDAIYCHAHCYALEGLLHLQATEQLDVHRLLLEGAMQLRRWQNFDGSLLNWPNGGPAAPLRVADATAQAVRIWLAVDRDAYAKPIRRGLQFLQRLRSPQLGLYYCTGSDDANSWASLFAVQALEWLLIEPRPDCIV